MRRTLFGVALAAPLAFGLACPALAQGLTGVFTATMSGFQPTPAYSQLAVSNVSSRVALPSGSTAVVYNTGASAAYVTLGNSSVTATTTAADVIQPNSWMAFAVGSNTHLAGITSSGATALVISGGVGLPAGAGGGSGGGSIPTGSAGSPNASVVSVQGVPGSIGLPVTGTFSQTTQPVSLASLPALAAGANTIGAVTQASGPWSFNQTQINGAAVNTGKGASSTGTARVVLSSDSPGGALANPGFNYITDGAHTVSVKAASTSAVSTDQSLVVQINPQQTPPISLSQINGSATVTSAPGVQEVGIVGHAGASFDATVSPGAAPTNMIVGGLQYNSSSPTLSSGQTVALQGDSSGNLKVDIVGGVDHNDLVTLNTTLQRESGNTGSTVPAAAIYAAMNVGGNLTGLTGTPNGLKVDGSAVTQPVNGTVTANLGTLNGAATAANQTAAQGATGSPVPSNAKYDGAISSGNLVGLIQADNSAAINVSTATTAQLVALSSGKKIYVTSYDVYASGSGSITLEYGTGTNCGTGTTALTGPYNLTATQASISKGGGLGPVLVVPAGNALCVVTTTAPMSGSVSYTQF